MYKYCANIVHTCPNSMQIYYKYQVEAWEVFNPVKSVSFYNDLWVSELGTICVLFIVASQLKTEKSRNPPTEQWTSNGLQIIIQRPPTNNCVMGKLGLIINISNDDPLGKQILQAYRRWENLFYDITTAYLKIFTHSLFTHSSISFLIYFSEIFTEHWNINQLLICSLYN